MTSLSNRQRQKSGSTRRKSLPSNATAELVSDLADVLRSPLASVRDSIESLCNADSGSVTGEQRTMLDSAMQQCQDLDRMIGKLLHIEDESTSVPSVHRRRVAVTDIRNTVDQQLNTDGTPTSIEVLWDGADDRGVTVLADPELLSQMIVHLVNQSISVTPEGGCVLIRLQAQPSRDVVRWSVIDQGPGIRESEFREFLDQQHHDRGSFGLANCQIIAALHFSSLDLYSRVGSGTEISFETPRSGPRSVAAVWSDWRIGQATAQQGRENNRPSGARRPEQRLRIDSTPARMSLSQSVVVPRCADQLTAGTVTLGATVSRTSADAFDQFLQRQTQMFDVVYRVGTRRWAWAFDDRAEDARGRIESLNDQAASVIPGIRMNWSEPLTMPIDSRLTNVRLSDLLIRETLSESTPTGMVDKDAVRMGTAPIEPSSLASERLEQELRRLSGRLKTQTTRLQRQSKQLRPRV